MKSILDDLYGHMAWADAEHWQALETVPAALEDEQIRRRLYHIHMVQNAFLSIVRNERAAYRRYEEFEEIVEVKKHGLAFHAAVSDFLGRLDAQRLSDELAIPWFKEPPLTITIRDALMQAAMHSQYHRGQNATRLRDLGGDPPLTDYIVWLWKDKPAAVWNL